ncbi:unnamed protein product [Adineta steineri]|uniref:Uncharacterized protein n=1 Tax=Adineta steineri TaxID=433720 RepID=A0A814Z7A6_9BILA|nr:unnamed protein product [Adineta steineri]
MMGCYLTLYSFLILSILLLNRSVESIQCSKNCSFSQLSLNSSFPSDLCSSSNESNNDTNAQCEVKLSIDLNNNLVNGSFDFNIKPLWQHNELEIITFFSLTDTSVKIDITYTCSMSDNCDIEFVRQTLTSKLASLQLESVRQTLANRLYNSTNTRYILCSNKGFCSPNTSFCHGMYIRQNATYSDQEDVRRGCLLSIDSLNVTWTQTYTPYTRYGLINTGSYYCNIPMCASDSVILETFQWLTINYTLPVNVSVLDIITPHPPTTTTTTTISTTTTPNHGSYLFGHINILVLCFVIIHFLIYNFLSNSLAKILLS